MHPQDFEVIVYRRTQHINATLQKKGAEYAPGADRLLNFRLGAKDLDQTMAAYDIELVTKAWVDVKRMALSGEVPGQEVADEKLGDIINYMILLDAIWAEERKKQ